ncbi:putative signal transduction protein with Nacht domain [Catenulispora acidiphila DSM 44928]|uniref:Putative signal transduction protein with Nacht domain n=2 Tax=Catenulispora TaxID=414878 RepID=C7Q0A5_CATAD|nr:putative signal transduction protein with Nacht domain [Catenulispora acidiphila DSM 44928]
MRRSSPTSGVTQLVPKPKGHTTECKPDRKSRPGSIGGRANEAGSLHRSGVAAYLAAHGLVGRAVEEAGYLPGGPTPAAVEFETHDDVDDIACTMTDGSRLLIQAKRACGIDDQFRSAVAQWVTQTPKLRRSDRVALAAAEISGNLRFLGQALGRHRKQISGPHTSDEKKAIADLDRAFPAGTSPSLRSAVRSCAYVLKLDVSTHQDPLFKFVASLLEGVVVPSGEGTMAIEALQRAFQEQAASGSGSGLDDWLRTLSQAGTTVYAAADGPAGPRRQAEKQALITYQTHLRGRKDQLEYSLLAEDLPPLKVADLAATFQVRAVIDNSPVRQTDELVSLTRHWTRMVLTGLPGMGKSTALEQLAALWSVNGSPVPILVRLASVARRVQRSSDVTVPLLVAEAAGGVSTDEVAPLRRALEQAIASGTAVLLLDGLDETGPKRGLIADGLLSAIEGLPDLTGIIITTRQSAIGAARKIGLPEAQLTEPKWLASTLHQLLHHVADRRILPKNRDSWVAEHIAWLNQAKNDSSEIWSVPMLATLLTLLSAEKSVESLPQSRAHLLADAVRDSVRRWEKARESGTLSEPWSPQLTDGILIDGYAIIGHRVNASGAASILTIERDIVSMLSTQWGRSAGEAKQLASEILRFWDDKIGVFVTREGDRLEARSRIFGEIGDAMWVAEQETATSMSWTAKAIADSERRDTLLLAAGLSPGILRNLIDLARGSHGDTPEADRDRALLWSSEIALSRKGIDHDLLLKLIDALALATRRKSTEDTRLPKTYTASITPSFTATFRRDNRRWRLVRALASLALPFELRERRDISISANLLEPEQDLIVDAMTSLSDARYDASTSLEPKAIDAVRKVLDSTIIERQDPDEATKSGNPIPTKRPWAGQSEVAEWAIPFLSQLPETTPEAIYEVAWHSSVGQYGRVSSTLRERGHIDTKPRWSPIDVSLEDISSTISRSNIKVWKSIESVSDERTPLTPAEQWRLPRLFAFSDTIGFGENTVPDCYELDRIDSVKLARWTRVVARTTNLDLVVLATEAALVLSWNEEEQQDLFRALSTSRTLKSPSPDVTRLEASDIDTLIESLLYPSRWVAHIAMNVLAATGDYAISPRIEECIHLMVAERRHYATTLVCTLSDDPAQKIETFLDETDPVCRSGAALALSTLPLDERVTDLVYRALSDRDMSVRIAAGADRSIAEQAEYWSCINCGNVTEVPKTSCAHCTHGFRPATPRVVIDSGDA